MALAECETRLREPGQTNNAFVADEVPGTSKDQPGTSNYYVNAPRLEIIIDTPRTSDNSVAEGVLDTTGKKPRTSNASLNAKQLDASRGNASVAIGKFDISSDKPETSNGPCVNAKLQDTNNGTQRTSNSSVAGDVLNPSREKPVARTCVADKRLDTRGVKPLPTGDTRVTTDNDPALECMANSIAIISDDDEGDQHGVQCDCGTSYVVYEEEIPVADSENMSNASDISNNNVHEEHNGIIQNPERDKNGRTGLGKFAEGSVTFETNPEPKVVMETVSNFRLLFIGVGSFVLYFCSWGMAQSFGVLYVELLDIFGGSRGETTWVLSIFGGILLLSETGSDNDDEESNGFIRNQEKDNLKQTNRGKLSEGSVTFEHYSEATVYNTKEVSNFRLLCIAVGSFILHFCSWGMAQSFGVMYVELLEIFGGSRGETTWVLSIFSGILLVSGPVAGILLRHFGCRLVGVAGSLFMAGGLLASVFTPSLHVLYVTYGIISGFGGSLLFTTAGVVVLQNFQKRASMILGICASGAAVGTLVIPLLTQASLERYGFRGTFLLLSGLCLQCLVMSFTFGADRKRKGESKHKPASEDNRRFRSTVQQYCSFFNLGYTLYAISWAFMMLPFLVPFTFLPDVALSRGTTKQEAAYIASALGLGSILGKAAFGFLGDVKSVETLIMHIVPIFLFGAINLVVVFVEGFVGFVLMATLIGLTSAICDGIHPVITLQLVGKEHLSVALGVLYFLMSVTTILGTPIAGWIADAAGRYDEPFYYCAASSCIAALAAVYVPFWKRKHRLTAIRQEMTITP